MCKCLFLGDSITDADHLFDPSGLGHGYVKILADSLPECTIKNKGQNGFTIQQLYRMLARDGIGSGWDVITILIGVNDIPVELYTSHKRLPDEFLKYYKDILTLVTRQSSARIILVEPFLFDYPLELKPWHKFIQIESLLIQKIAWKYHAHFLSVDHRLRTAALEQGVENITVDGIHLTPKGNQILADLWLSLFKSFSL